MVAIRKLSEIQPGEKGKIIDITGERTYVKRLNDMGLLKGTVVEMVRNAPLGDPMEIIVRDYKLTLRKAEVDGVIIEIE
ncbi:MAG: FeoA family protein [Candidatus Helarchaeota archaeon]